MISRGSPAFWHLLGGLSDHGQRLARDAYQRFMTDPGHPGLRFKKLDGSEDFWSVRVGAQYRAVCRRRGDTVEWFWIGTHGEYDKIVG